ncbi:MAG: hypothetical protein DWQ47_17250 [Acidobacteria bacterium]|nr:MAG: hypothetical protein DWQ32_04650 [Acidobacteriota bacterium]REK02212.1 MAG: hypothetical protein DWQ38_07500 [Acidobacteriota bacterium]REK13985.1 MAG: hypothetical protein DWQ43_10340 [Acidobacteriota bacterium]REK41980.1 MAG: hypothetical protein DWQ47_17250 [Acidobacteriota bacterium]
MNFRPVNRTSIRISAALLVLATLFAVPCFSQTPNETADLERAISSGSVEEKRDALYRIRVLGTEESARLAVRALRDPEPIVRATAAGSLANLPSSEAVPVLVQLLKDKDEFVRKEAAIALGQTYDASAEMALLETLENGDEEAVRAAAAEALGKTGTGASLPTLTRTLSQKPKDRNQTTKRSAARSVGMIAGRLRKSAVFTSNPENFLPSKFKSTERSLVDLTNTDRGFQAISTILRQIIANEREHTDTKREAAFALGMIGDADALDSLRNCSSDVDPYLAESCKEAILMIDSQ